MPHKLAAKEISGRDNTRGENAIQEKKKRAAFLKYQRIIMFY